MGVVDQARRRLYRGGHAHGPAQRLNRFQATLAARGIGPSWLVRLEVTGRRTGRTISLPVVIADHDHERFLVAMLGDQAAWVRNVRAAGGAAVLRHGSAVPVHLEEVPPAGRAPVLRRYLERARGARAHFPVPPDAPLADFERIADRYPVFRICPARGTR
jgi:deazaflavin-dependent oxidoreductase (nitroreductase family)